MRLTVNSSGCRGVCEAAHVAAPAHRATVVACEGIWHEHGRLVVRSNQERGHKRGRSGLGHAWQLRDFLCQRRASLLADEEIRIAACLRRVPVGRSSRSCEHQPPDQRQHHRSHRRAERSARRGASADGSKRALGGAIADMSTTFDPLDRSNKCGSHTSRPIDCSTRACASLLLCSRCDMELTSSARARCARPPAASRSPFETMQFTGSAATVPTFSTWIHLSEGLDAQTAPRRPGSTAHAADPPRRRPRRSDVGRGVRRDRPPAQRHHRRARTQFCRCVPW